jgi:hypothetical protein
MSIQNTIRQFPTDGIVGDFALDGPIRSQPILLNTADPTLNVIGRAVTHTAATDGVGVTGGTGVFAGILTNSKQYASLGGSTGPLSPTLTLPNALPVQATTLASGIFVTLSTTANIGDQVYFVTATGVLGAVAPGAAAPGGGQLIPGASVIRRNITTANTTAIIELLNS